MRSFRGRSGAGWLLAGAVAIGCAAGASSGQVGGGVAGRGSTQAPATRLTPPAIAPPREPEGLSFAAMLWTVVVVAVAVGANMLPTKRGHKD